MGAGEEAISAGLTNGSMEGCGTCFHVKSYSRIGEPAIKSDHNTCGWAVLGIKSGDIYFPIAVPINVNSSQFSVSQTYGTLAPV